MKLTQLLYNVGLAMVTICSGLLVGCGSPAENAGAPAGTEGASMESSAGQNWAKSFSYGARRYEEPRTLEELQAIIRQSDRLKPLGSRHSFSKVADTEGTLVSMQHFAEIGEVDPKLMTVTVGGGVRYGDLCQRLDAQGYALHNLASLPHISIAGAISTGTHGSGSGNGNLTTAVEALELVTPMGDVRHFSRNQQSGTFDGVVVGLGALGFITKVTLRVQPRFEMRQYVFEDLPLASLQQHFDAVMDAAYSVSLFTTWGTGGIEEVWVKSRTDSAKPFDATPLFFGAKAAAKDLHPIRALSPEHCTPQLGVAGPWHERLPHFKMGFTPSSGEELQSEFFVARKDALPALNAIFALHEKVAPVLQISEVRAVKGDDLWLSPASGRDSIAIHFTWKKDEAGVLAVLPFVEAALRPYGARPHWGKVFTVAPEDLQGRYPKLEAFRALRRELDPEGKLRNPFVDAIVGN